MSNLFEQRVAWALQRFRSIMNESLLPGEFELLFGDDYMVSEESALKFREIADSGQEFDYATLYTLHYLASNPKNMGFRAVWMLVMQYDGGVENFDNRLAAMLKRMKGE